MNAQAAHPARVVIIGAGGHGRVLLDALRQAAAVEVLGFCDAHEQLHGVTLHGVPVIGNDEDLLRDYKPDDVALVNGLGSVGDSGPRGRVFELFRRKGYRFASVIHPRAIVAADVRLGEGVQIMAGAIVQSGAQLGENVLVNTGAIVDHGCRLGDHVHVASGAVLSGDVVVGEAAHVGTGATVIQGIQIGPRALVAAGAVVIYDVGRDTKVVGVPARER